jgi:hypothetical protein
MAWIAVARKDFALVSRLTRSLAPLAALAALLALAPAAAADTTATAAKSCRVGDSRSYGTTYVLSIGVTNTSCRAGRRVIRAFHGCRPGKAGHCNERVLGYSCSESRYDKIRTQYSGRVSCTKGSKKVTHRYTQFT